MKPNNNSLSYRAISFIVLFIFFFSTFTLAFGSKIDCDYSPVCTQTMQSCGECSYQTRTTACDGGCSTWGLCENFYSTGMQPTNISDGCYNGEYRDYYCPGDSDTAIYNVIVHNDPDGDGFDECSDCDQTDATVHPNATEVCDGIDNDCDGEIDENPDALCDDGAYCNGQERCQSGSCTAGTPIDCSANDLGPIAECSYSPDDNPLTYDSFSGFTSTCDEASDSCTTGSVTLTHSCDIAQCGAACESDADCSDNSCSQTYDDYCNGTRLVEYDSDLTLDSTTVTDSCTNGCLSDCSCEDCTTDCSEPTTQSNCVIGECGATCADDTDCAGTTDCDTLDGCYDGNYRNYSDVSGTCIDCGCVDGDCSGSYTEESPSLADNQQGVCSGALKQCDNTSIWLEPDYASYNASYETDEVTCDGLDNDCDGTVDEGLTTRYYLDNDSDGYGNASSFVDACSQPVGHVLDNTDCDDNNGSIYQSESFYVDFDSDGYDNGTETLCAGSGAPDGYSNTTLGTDCDDSVASCNTDCSSVLYFDSDNDGFGNVSITHRACDATTDYISDSTDCNDANGSINPNATEVNDHVDNDCDGSIDENNQAPTVTPIPSISFNRSSSELVILSDYFSDPDGDSLSYNYTVNSTNLTVALVDNTATLTTTIAGNYSITFSANDSFGGSVSSTDVSVTVNKTNLGVPAIDSIWFNESSIYTDTVFSFDFNYSDADNDPIETYDYQIFVNDSMITSGSDTNVVTETSQWSKGDTVTVSVRGCDWGGCGEWSNHSVVVEDSLPVISNFNFSTPERLTLHDEFSCEASYYDADLEDHDLKIEYYINDTLFTETGVNRSPTENGVLYSAVADEFYTYGVNNSIKDIGSNFLCIAYVDGLKNETKVSSINKTIKSAYPVINTVKIQKFDFAESTRVFDSGNLTFVDDRVINISGYVDRSFQITRAFMNDLDNSTDWIGQDINIEVIDGRDNSTLTTGSNLWWSGSEELVATGYDITYDSLGVYKIYINATDEYGLSDLVTVNVNVTDGRRAPTMSCSNQNVSDGWENMGMFLCTCSNNYVSENETIKLSDMSSKVNDYYDNEFNMSISLEDITPYGAGSYNTNYSYNPFDRVSDTSYQWFPLWNDTNKTFRFNVSCETPKGLVSEDVVVNVSEGDYDFWDSAFLAFDETNVSGNGINSTPISGYENTTEFTNNTDHSDVELMRKLLGTNDLSLLIYYTQKRWNETPKLKNGFADNSTSTNFLGITIDEIMYNYNNYLTDDTEKWFIVGSPPTWDEEWGFNCTENNLDQCKNSTGDYNGYTMDYSVKIKKLS